jgi:hypothetical protein
MQSCRSALLLICLSIFVGQRVAYASTTKTDKSVPSASADLGKTGRAAQAKTKAKAGQASASSQRGGPGSSIKYEGWQVIQSQGYIGMNQIFLCDQGVKVVNPLFLLIFRLKEDTVIIANTQTQKALVNPSEAVANYLTMMGYRIDKKSEFERKYTWSSWKRTKVAQKFGMNAGLYERQILNPPLNSSRKEMMWVATDFKVPRKLLNAFLRFTDNKNSVGFPLERRTIIESPKVGYKVFDELTTKDVKRITLTDADLRQPKGYGLVKDFSELIYNDEGGESLSQLANDLRKKAHHSLPADQSDKKQTTPLNQNNLLK